MSSDLIPQQDPETGLFDIGSTVTARSIGFTGPVLITPALWQVCIFRDGADATWPERVNELLTSLRSTYNKAAADDRELVFTPPFGHHWKPLKAIFYLGESEKPEMLIQLFSEVTRRWPPARND